MTRLSGGKPPLLGTLFTVAHRGPCLRALPPRWHPDTCMYCFIFVCECAAESTFVFVFCKKNYLLCTITTDVLTTPNHYYPYLLLVAPVTFRNSILFSLCRVALAVAPFYTCLCSCNFPEMTKLLRHPHIGARYTVNRFQPWNCHSLKVLITQNQTTFSLIVTLTSVWTVLWSFRLICIYVQQKKVN